MIFLKRISFVPQNSFLRLNRHLDQVKVVAKGELQVGSTERNGHRESLGPTNILFQTTGR